MSEQELVAGPLYVYPAGALWFVLVSHQSPQLINCRPNCCILRMRHLHTHIATEQQSLTPSAHMLQGAHMTCCRVHGCQRVRVVVRRTVACCKRASSLTSHCTLQLVRVCTKGAPWLLSYPGFDVSSACGVCGGAEVPASAVTPHCPPGGCWLVHPWVGPPLVHTGCSMVLQQPGLWWCLRARLLA